ncbi:hypothetical protein Bca52824_033294 [Brassica carinata]|uniref:Uncharacterized protein n=1 Tax=Brassica carinata TaxID=52824 RepID=A0A8X7SC82_BRACI|nr:hypothetical protein Bca52824_033294 [Brassica carinata]
MGSDQHDGTGDQDEGRRQRQVVPPAPGPLKGRSPAPGRAAGAGSRSLPRKAASRYPPALSRPLDGAAGASPPAATEPRQASLARRSAGRLSVAGQVGMPGARSGVRAPVARATAFGARWKAKKKRSGQPLDPERAAGRARPKPPARIRGMLICTYMRGIGRMDKSMRGLKVAGRVTRALSGRLDRHSERAVGYARDEHPAREQTACSRSGTRDLECAGTDGWTREVRGLVCAGEMYRMGSKHHGRPECAGVYARDGRPARDRVRQDRTDTGRTRG